MRTDGERRLRPAAAAALALTLAGVANGAAVDGLWLDDLHLSGAPNPRVELQVRALDANANVLREVEDWRVEVRTDGKRIQAADLAFATVQEARRGIALALVIDPVLRGDRGWPRIAAGISRLAQEFEPRDRLSIISAAAPPILLASSTAEVEPALAALQLAQPGSLLAAIELAAQWLEESSDMPRRRSVVVIADGAPTSAGDFADPPALLTRIQGGETSPRVVVGGLFIGAQPAVPEAFFDSLVAGTGGRSQNVASVALVEGLLIDWREQMGRTLLLGFGVEPDGLAHQIELIVGGRSRLRTVSYPLAEAPKARFGAPLLLVAAGLALWVLAAVVHLRSGARGGR